ncbi:hypothetical protein C0J52_14654 [Blattella germanica]|nr:hypothetical protein C0J52_14654 [Blattella germanica]
MDMSESSADEMLGTPPDIAEAASNVKIRARTQFVQNMMQEEECNNINRKRYASIFPRTLYYSSYEAIKHLKNIKK